MCLSDSIGRDCDGILVSDIIREVISNDSFPFDIFVSLSVRIGLDPNLRTWKIPARISKLNYYIGNPMKPSTLYLNLVKGLIRSMQVLGPFLLEVP